MARRETSRELEEPRVVLQSLEAQLLLQTPGKGRPYKPPTQRKVATSPEQGSLTKEPKYAQRVHNKPPPSVN